MDINQFKSLVVKQLSALSWPQRLNGFQVAFFERRDEVRQYSTGLPPTPFRDELEVLLGEMIECYDESFPRLRERDLDKRIREVTGNPPPQPPDVEFIVTIVKQPAFEIKEQWWASNTDTRDAKRKLKE